MRPKTSEGASISSQLSNFEALIASEILPCLLVIRTGHIISRNAAARRVLANSSNDLFLLSAEPSKTKQFIANCAATSGPLPGRLTFLNPISKPQSWHVNGGRLAVHSDKGPVVILRLQEMNTSSTFTKLNEQLARLHLDLGKQRALARSAAHFSALVQSSNDAIISKTLDGFVISWNAAAEKMFGYSGSEIIGASISNVVPENLMQEEREMLEHIRAGKRLDPFETLARKRDGTQINVLKTLSPIRDSEQNVVAVSSIVHDITERKKIESSLKESQERLQNLMNSTAEGIYGVDLEGNCNFANQACADLLGYPTPSAFLGKNMHSLIHHKHSDGSHYPRENCSIYKSFLTGQKINIDNEVFWKSDGTSFPVEFWSHPIKRDNRVAGAVVTFIDISERKFAENQRELLLREVNHRAKNLLTVVLSMARSSAEYCSLGDFVNQFSQRVQGLADSQDLIVKGSWEGVTLKELILSQLKHLGLDILDKRVKMVGDNIELAPASAQAIGMAIHELSTNALKYGALKSESGRVAIEWKINKNRSELYIRWRETGGPPISTPSHRGFGTTVIEEMVAMAAGGNVKLEFPEAGLVWELRAPAQNCLSSRPKFTYAKGEHRALT